MDLFPAHNSLEDLVLDSFTKEDHKTSYLLNHFNAMKVVLVLSDQACRLVLL